MADGTLKVGTITTSSGSGTITLGQSGETISVPSGATFSATSGTMSGQNYPAFEAYLSADQTFTASTYVKTEFDTEIFDTDNCYDNTTNYRFTPTVAGKYFVYSGLLMAVASDNITLANIVLRKNGTNIRLAELHPHTSGAVREVSLYASLIIDMNGTTDYLEVFGYAEIGGGSSRFESNDRSCYFGAYRIGA